MLPLCMFDVLQTGFMCLSVFVLVAAAVPVILPVFFVLLVVFYYFRSAHWRCSRPLARPCPSLVAPNVSLQRLPLRAPA
jgi:hypothetical protein